MSSSQYTDLRLDLPETSESDITTQAEIDRAIAEFGEVIVPHMVDLYQTRALGLVDQCLDADGRLQMRTYRQRLSELVKEYRDGS